MLRKVALPKAEDAVRSIESLRLGLCCTFSDQPIKFRTTTVAALLRLSRPDALNKLSTLCLANADALQDALQFCADHGIGCFRILSQILPIKTHSVCGYAIEALPDGDEIVRRFRACGTLAREHSIRTSFHPDQFVVLNSLRPDVVDRSIEELVYQAEVAEWVGADVLNIHAGAANGDKPAALQRLAQSLERLPDAVRTRLTIENDDVTYTPSDILPLCRSEGIPLVYDVHHHRCHSDGLSIEEATRLSMATWNREPMFHLSSPLEGWAGPKANRHHDFIDIADFPECWRELPITIEVEAKAKELAVLKLRKQLAEQWMVYILLCADGSLYTGITNHLARRIKQHDAGTASRYTRSRLPVKLVYWETQAHGSAALKRELAIKALHRNAKIALIRSLR